MAFLILLALLALPFVEISLFIEAGRAIGIPATLGLTILTAVGGIAIVRHQGLQNFRRMQEAMERNEPPIAEIVHGMLLLIAGVFLLLPGFLTDTVGALLLIPPVRAMVGASFFRFLERRHRRAGDDHVIIDAEFWEADNENTPRTIEGGTTEGRRADPGDDERP